jgi:hypothetical protein
MLEKDAMFWLQSVAPTVMISGTSPGVRTAS